MNSSTAHGSHSSDRLDEGLFIRAGGCGTRLAARDAWDDPLPAGAFRAILRD
jgi:hypothetical protein